MNSRCSVERDIDGNTPRAKENDSFRWIVAKGLRIHVIKIHRFVGGCRTPGQAGFLSKSLAQRFPGLLACHYVKIDAFGLKNSFQ